MHIGQAVDIVSRYDSLCNLLTFPSDFMVLELVSRCLAESGTITLRKRRLPLEMMIWFSVSGNHEIFHLRIMPPGRDLIDRAAKARG